MGTWWGKAGGSGRAVLLFVVLVVTAAGVVSDLAIGQEASEPQVWVETEMVRPSGSDWPAADGRSTFAPGQPFRVGCFFGNGDRIEYTVRVTANTGGFSFEPESSGIRFATNRIAGPSGVKWFSVTSTDAVRRGSVEITCELYPVVLASQPSTPTGGAGTIRVEPTTVYVEPPAAGTVDEGEATSVRYYGWTSERASVRLYADGRDDPIESGSLDGTVERLSVVPSEYIDVTESREVGLRLTSMPPLYVTNFVRDEDELDTWSVRVNTVPRITSFGPGGDEYPVGKEIEFFANAVDYDDEDESPSRELDYQWEFGDSNGANGATVTHEYDREGSYEVSVTVTDDEGSTTTETMTVTVTNDAPDVEIVAPPGPVQVDQEVELMAKTFNLEDTNPTYTWRFHDGTQRTGRTVTYEYDDPGTFEVELTVENRFQASAVERESVTVRNERPVIERGPTFAPQTDGVVVRGDPIQFTAQAYDPDGKEVSYDWEFGGDSPNPTDPEVEHTYTAAGTYTVTLTVVDDEGTVAVERRTITVRNRTFAERVDALSLGEKIGILGLVVAILPLLKVGYDRVLGRGNGGSGSAR